MEVKHRIRCFESDVLVCEDGSLFNINIQARSNPLGFGRTLGAFEALEQAVEAAEHFCLAYRVAMKHGYYLKGDKLIRHEREPIAVEWVLQRCLSEQEWCDLLTSKVDAS